MIPVFIFRMGKNNSKIDNMSAGGLFCKIDKDGNISDYAIDNAIEEMKPHVKVGNATNLPFEDNSFDIVISITTIHNLDKDEIIALQISHNSIGGTDDKGILKRLMDEISSIEFKEFAFIPVDDMNMEDMFSASVVPIQEHYRVSFVLYAKDIKLIQDHYSLLKQ